VTGLLQHHFSLVERGEGAEGMGGGGPYLHQIAMVDGCIDVSVVSNGGRGWV
jgi:hypothetical protein